MCKCVSHCNVPCLKNGSSHIQILQTCDHQMWQGRLIAAIDSYFSSVIYPPFIFFCFGTLLFFSNFLPIFLLFDPYQQNIKMMNLLETLLKQQLHFLCWDWWELMIKKSGPGQISLCSAVFRECFSITIVLLLKSWWQKLVNRCGQSFIILVCPM